MRVHAHFTNKLELRHSSIEVEQLNYKKDPTTALTSTSSTQSYSSHIQSSDIVGQHARGVEAKTQRARTGNTHTVTSLSQRCTIHNPSKPTECAPPHRHTTTACTNLEKCSSGVHVRVLVQTILQVFARISTAHKSATAER
jgi:hypothetical protein